MNCEVVRFQFVNKKNIYINFSVHKVLLHYRVFKSRFLHSFQIYNLMETV